ncbi:MAG: SDR family oxidoreductase [Bdellovibrionaceae bacterium]|nr:SDR family oxidoreductase [Bdellovibrionales bacterium]MCB9086438.1 SDR family oxidoreductase [Pseudobdellovibrionaceae bacterium]
MKAQIGIRLTEKTIIIGGPFSGLTRSLATTLTEAGADVVMIAQDVDHARRFAENLSDAREVHPEYGRAAAMAANLCDPKQAHETVSRVAELFGTIEGYVDLHASPPGKPLNDPHALSALDEVIDTCLRPTLIMAHATLKFLEGRKKGRLIFILQDALRLGFPEEAVGAACRTGLQAFCLSLAREVMDQNITVNCVTTGFSEDYYLSRHPGSASQSATEEKLRHNIKHLRTTSITDVANMVAYLLSPLSQSLTGQTISVNQGLT